MFRFRGLGQSIRAFSTTKSVSNQDGHKVLQDILSLARMRGNKKSADSKLFGVENLNVKFPELKGARSVQIPEQPLLDNQAVADRIFDYTSKQVPRTGVMAGRSVPVQGPMNLSAALRHLNIINQANKIRKVLSLQRYHERPGKVKLRLRNEKARRDFNKGIRHLFDLVGEARRKGY